MPFLASLSFHLTLVQYRPDSRFCKSGTCWEELRTGRDRPSGPALGWKCLYLSISIYVYMIIAEEEEEVDPSVTPRAEEEEVDPSVTPRALAAARGRGFARKSHPYPE
jgi:hypothetical protein